MKEKESNLVITPQERVLKSECGRSSHPDDLLMDRPRLQLHQRKPVRLLRSAIHPHIPRWRQLAHLCHAH
jgi:hypothetical protein